MIFGINITRGIYAKYHYKSCYYLYKFRHILWLYTFIVVTHHPALHFLIKVNDHSFAGFHLPTAYLKTYGTYELVATLSSEYLFYPNERSASSFYSWEFLVELCRPAP